MFAVIGAKAGGALIRAAGLQAGAVAGVDHGVSWGLKGDHRAIAEGCHRAILRQSQIDGDGWVGLAG